MKKSICKGDKKRKKEVTEEIVKLEGDLDRKQDEEMACLKLSQMSVDKTEVEIKNSATNMDDETIINESNEEESKKPARVSKAQKRRDKKEIAERERNQRIIEQEALNVHGKRNIEIQAIKNILTKRDLTIHEIPSDGNWYVNCFHIILYIMMCKFILHIQIILNNIYSHCSLYNAIAHQLKLIGDSLALDLSDLRKKTAIYLRENVDNFLPFINNPDSDELLSHEQYQKYCDNVAETNAWGGAVEVGF